MNPVCVIGFLFSTKFEHDIVFNNSVWTVWTATSTINGSQEKPEYLPEYSNYGMQRIIPVSFESGPIKFLTFRTEMHDVLELSFHFVEVV
jgi:hypothetical protein